MVGRVQERYSGWSYKATQGKPIRNRSTSSGVIHPVKKPTGSRSSLSARVRFPGGSQVGVPGTRGDFLGQGKQGSDSSKTGLSLLSNSTRT